MLCPVTRTSGIGLLPTSTKASVFWNSAYIGCFNPTLAFYLGHPPKWLNLDSLLDAKTIAEQVFIGHWIRNQIKIAQPCVKQKGKPGLFFGFAFSSIFLKVFSKFRIWKCCWLELGSISLHVYICVHNGNNNIVMMKPSTAISNMSYNFKIIRSDGAIFLFPDCYKCRLSLS